MTTVAMAAFAFLAAPFWETKSAKDWTQNELHQLMHDSPWARERGAQIYLASAQPLREAEERLKKQSPYGAAVERPDLSDYEEFLRENPGRYIVVAIGLPDANALNDSAESRLMEQKSVLKVGKKKFKIVGHFPPTPWDPYLRLIYPREVDETAKRITMELYLPSVRGPYQLVEFDLKEMMYKGKLEY
ncbi:MAG: hypothetical protein JJE04_02425 [Acidobacteriia bacterium]|nr:hypothetical protein [Terriglobia bacterium]